MRLKAYLPLLVFAILAVALWIGLSLKPSEVPSVLVGKPVPEFTLSALYDDGEGLSADMLRQPGVKVVNVWASWCAPCRVEHPQLMALAKVPGITLYGIAYKDRRDAAQKFLQKLGNPFAAVGADDTGRVSIDWGVYGVPETFLVDGAGNIVYRHVGVISEYDLDEKFMPLLRQLGAAS
jgi:cytochrome c biogenesis protein CcmG/thiol:disulfide interchange protein DsbE